MTSSSFGRHACESVLHQTNSVPAVHVINLVDDPVGYYVCDACLMHYVENVYVAGVVGQHFAFGVMPV